MNKPLISLTSDFGVQSQGVGIMEGVIAGINPEARVIHLMHGLPDFDLRSGARTMETVINLPVGFHVCVVDPGVGTRRKSLIIQTKRGDFLIGPDNGVLMSAVRLLGDATRVVEITNPNYMRHPVSPIFHGRDIFAPAAAYLSGGVSIGEFGPEVDFNHLTPAPYTEAILEGGTLHAEVIHINKYGSLHLNVLNAQWDAFGVPKYQRVRAEFKNQRLELTCITAFGEVNKNELLILRDDYGRVEVAINQGNFAAVYGVGVGNRVKVDKIN